MSVLVIILGYYDFSLSVQHECSKKQVLRYVIMASLGLDAS